MAGEQSLRQPRDWADQLKSPHRPVTCLSLWEARAYARWLNEDPEWQRAQSAVAVLAGLRVGLPTELQWERAARLDAQGGAHRHPWPWDDEAASWERRANIKESGVGRVSPVGCFAPNPFGVWDLAGNACEWIDNAAEDPAHALRRLTVADEPSLEEMHQSVLRGGAFDFSAACARASFRHWDLPHDTINGVGFRVVLSMA